MATHLIRTGLREDAHTILRQPSDITKAELDTHRLDWWCALKDVHEWMKQGPAETLTENGRPIAMFGHFPHPEFTGRVTWFIASQRFWALGPRGVILARKYLRSLRLRWPNITFYSQSASPHPDMERWFTLLGYTAVYDACKGLVCFKFSPEINASDTTPVAC